MQTQHRPNFLFSLPYTPGMYDVLKELPANISDVYFSDNAFGSARALSLSEENLAELRAIRKDFGIALHYLVNGNYYANDFYEKAPELVEHVASLQVDILTLNNTYLLRDAGFISALRRSNPSLAIKNSVNNKPKSLKDVVFLTSTLGVKDVVLDRSLNRDLDELRKISQFCKEQGVSTTLLVNEGCIVDCMWKNFDDMLIAQTTPKSNMIVINAVQQELGCSRYFSESPGRYLKTGFTLPNDLDKFEGLVDVIKLAGRHAPLAKWLVMCKAYMNSDANVQLQHLFSTKPPATLQRVTANELLGYDFSKLTSNCKNVCGTECTLCDSLVSKLDFSPRSKQ